MRTLLTPLLVLLCVLTSWAEEFETDVPPKFSFTEVYNDRIVRGDPELGDYEIIPDTLIKVTAVCSMKGVDLGTIDESTTFSINFEGLVETWFLSDDPNYKKGKTSAKIPLYGFDFATGEELQIGSVNVSWTKKIVTITISAKNDPDSYQIMGQDRAFDGEATDDFRDFATVSLSFGDRELTGRTVYVGGSIKYVDYETEEIFETLARVSLKGEIDSKPPVITLLKPSQGAEINDPEYVLQGTVADDNGVASLFVQFNDEEEIEVIPSADGTWSVPAAFTPGTNVIKVRALDLDGNEGVLKPRKVVFLLASNLVVRAAGTSAGKVASEIFNTISFFPGQPSPERILLRNENQKTVLKAVPAPDSLFKEWTSNYPLTDPTSPKLTFKMRREMTVTAHFVPNIFLPVKGGYTGLVSSDNPDGRGGFNLKLGPTGSFSGTIKLGKKTVRLKGRFDSDGNFVTVVKAGGTKYEITLSLAESQDASDQIVGSFRPVVPEGGTPAFVSTVASDRAAFGKQVTVSEALVGTYNALIVADQGNEDPGFPRGHGFAQVSLSKFGAARFVGKLGDGTAFSANAKLSSDNGLSIYVPLYKKKGSISGRVEIDLAGQESDVSGMLAWDRPTTGSSGLNFGFSGESQFIGVKYAKPAEGQRLILNPDGLGRFVLDAPAEGGAPALHQEVLGTLSTSNQFTLDDPAVSLTISFNSKKGTFQGKFAQSGGKPTKFSGLVLPGPGPKGNVAGGWFKRGGTTGAIEISPRLIQVP